MKTKMQICSSNLIHTYTYIQECTTFIKTNMHTQVSINPCTYTYISGAGTHTQDQSCTFLHSYLRRSWLPYLAPSEASPMTMIDVRGSVDVPGSSSSPTPAMSQKLSKREDGHQATGGTSPLPPVPLLLSSFLFSRSLARDARRHTCMHESAWHTGTHEPALA